MIFECKNFSVIVSSALLNSLGKLDVPFMTLPFNFIIIVCFLNFQSEDYTPPSSSGTSINTTDIDWTRVIEGTVLSMGQVYAIQGLATSIFMWIALALYSPLLAILSAVGAILGSFLPLTFLEPGSYESVYSGLWGYNCILSVAAVSWACFSFSWSVLIFICGPKFIWPTSDSGNHCLLVLPMELQLFLCKSPW